MDSYYIIQRWVYCYPFKSDLWYSLTNLLEQCPCDMFKVVASFSWSNICNLRHMHS